MVLEVDFLSLNTKDKNPGIETDDLLSLQGFYLNALPTKEEMSYSQTGYYATPSDARRNMTASIWVQLREDLNPDGTLTDEAEARNEAYDPAMPNKIREQKDGYRLIHYSETDEEKTAYPNGYYMENGQKKAVEPRQIARMQFEYGMLAAHDSQKGNLLTDDRTLVLPMINLSGISRYADIKLDTNEATRPYAYTYRVSLTQKYYYDASYSDNFTTLPPGTPTEDVKDQTASDSELQFKEENKINQTVESDDANSTAIEKDTYLYTVDNSIAYAVRRRIPKVAIDNDAFASMEDAMEGADSKALQGYRPDQLLWTRLSVESSTKDPEEHVVFSNGAAGSSEGDGNTAYNAAEWSIGTGRVYRVL